MPKTLTPRTLAGIKSLAKDIKRTQGVSHTSALETAARQAGFQNFQHARHALENAAQAPIDHSDNRRQAFRDRNTARWTKIVEDVNPQFAAQQIWTGSASIIRALRPFMGENVNHTLLPTGGGMDARGVRASFEQNCICLEMSSRSDYVVRPNRLILETFADHPGESFLLLELSELQQSGVYDYLVEDGDEEALRRHAARRQEELVNVNETYLERGAWDTDSWIDDYGQEAPLPDDARLTVRWMNGKMLIVAKGSLWNSVTSTYDGRHDAMTCGEIRNAIQTNLIDKTSR